MSATPWVRRACWALAALFAGCGAALLVLTLAWGGRVAIPLLPPALVMAAGVGVASLWLGTGAVCVLAASFARLGGGGRWAPLAAHGVLRSLLHLRPGLHGAPLR